MKLTEFSTLTFDCYGTLIDWETGIYNALQPLLQMVEPSPNRDEALKIFSELESGIQTESRSPDISISRQLTNCTPVLANQSATGLPSQIQPNPFNI